MRFMTTRVALVAPSARAHALARRPDNQTSLLVFVLVVVVVAAAAAAAAVAIVVSP